MASCFPLVRIPFRFGQVYGLLLPTCPNIFPIRTSLWLLASCLSEYPSDSDNPMASCFLLVRISFRFGQSYGFLLPACPNTLPIRTILRPLASYLSEYPSDSDKSMASCFLLVRISFRFGQS